MSDAGETKLLNLNTIVPVNIEEELKQSYLDYAMSVIVGRALPDVRDGLKPVHRRIFYSMHEVNNDFSHAYKKSARIVGDVMGKYHPHGDAAIYDSMVRMAQEFSMRYPLVDGQGNFGSVDGDPPAAMRYTEVRMAKITQYLLADLEKETVNFVPNYDDSEFQPVVLPTRLPNLLINGASGIAVGMATNIPPHRISEIIQACLELLKNPNLTVPELMKYVPGPDFPTGGIIQGRAGILSAYQTGRGRIYVRGRAEIETEKNQQKQKIIITELPYQVNKARLLEKIAELVKDKKLEGISGLRDESDKDGMRVVIELKRGENSDVILNNLYTQTALQSVFGINFVALVDNQPKVLGLKDCLNYFLLHRQEIVSRRTAFELKQARARAHLLEGLTVALANLDPVIQLIKSSSNPQDAKQRLISQGWTPGTIEEILNRAAAAGVDEFQRVDLSASVGLQKDGKQVLYWLSDIQAQAILDLRLHRLTGLEQEKLTQEFENLINNIQDYLHILNNPERLKQVIQSELESIQSEFSDARRTVILEDDSHRFEVEDLIPEENLCVTLSQDGYIKTQALTEYQAQRRGGRGKSATQVKSEDYITNLIIASSHDYLLCFSNLGRLYWLKTYQIPSGSRQARGRPIVNLLPLQPDEKISALLAVSEFSDRYAVFFATKQGLVKQTALSLYSKPRAGGILAIDLLPKDQLIGVHLADQNNLDSIEAMLCSDSGKAVRFALSEVRLMGRSARGVKGMRLKPDQSVVSAMVLNPERGAILTVTENGFGKRTELSQYTTVSRGSGGVINIQTTSRNGRVIGACQVNESDEIMLMTDQGMVVRTRVSEISLVGRNTQGVNLITLSQGTEKVVDVSLVPSESVDELLEKV